MKEEGCRPHWGRTQLTNWDAEVNMQGVAMLSQRGYLLTFSMHYLYNITIIQRYTGYCRLMPVILLDNFGLSIRICPQIP